MSGEKKVARRRCCGRLREGGRGAERQEWSVAVRGDVTCLTGVQPDGCGGGIGVPAARP